MGRLHGDDNQVPQGNSAAVSDVVGHIKGGEDPQGPTSRGPCAPWVTQRVASRCGSECGGWRGHLTIVLPLKGHVMGSQGSLEGW